MLSKDEPPSEDTIECNANAFLWANETKQVILNDGGLPGNESTTKNMLLVPFATGR